MAAGRRTAESTKQYKALEHTWAVVRSMPGHVLDITTPSSSSWATWNGSILPKLLLSMSLYLRRPLAETGGSSENTCGGRGEKVATKNALQHILRHLAVIRVFGKEMSPHEF